MKLNQSKGHLNIGETKIWESNNEKLLGLAIDRNLNIDDQVFIFCKKFGRKLSALSRTSNGVSFEKKIILLKTFVESHFGYCPLICKFMVESPILKYS